MDCLELKPSVRRRLASGGRALYVGALPGGFGPRQVAAVVGLSPSHFSHLLCDRMDTSFRDLLNDMRIRRACDFLRRTERSLAQIA